jgi:type II secretory pathway component PulJ
MDDDAIQTTEELVSQINSLKRALEAVGRDLQEAVQQAHIAQTTSMGAFTMLLSLSRALATLKRADDAKVAMILTVNEQNQLNEIVRRAEKAVQVIDPTGEATKHVDAMVALSKQQPSIVLVKGG